MPLHLDGVKTEERTLIWDNSANPALRARQSGTGYVQEWDYGAASRAWLDVNGNLGLAGYFSAGSLTLSGNLSVGGTFVLTGSGKLRDYLDLSSSGAQPALGVHLIGGAGNIFQAKDSGSVLAMRVLSTRLVNIGASGTSVCGIGADDALFGGKVEVAGTAYLRGLAQVGNVGAAGHSPTGLHVAGVNELDGRTYLDDVLSAAGSAAFHDGTEPTWGHSPKFAVEGVAEFDSKAWFDDAAAVGGSLAVTGAATITGAVTLGGALRFSQDREVSWASRNQVLISSGCDANALNLRFGLYNADNAVPVLTVQSTVTTATLEQDFGLFDGLTQANIAVLEKGQRIARSACASHTGSARSRLIQSGDFGSATVGDLVRLTAGTCVTAGWYWVDDTPATSAVVLDRNFVAAQTAPASNVAFVLYHNFPMISAEGVKMKVFDGAPGDANFEMDMDGWTGLDAATGSGRLYFRAQNTWRYVSATAGFEVPAKETLCPVCLKEMQPGQAVAGLLDEILGDGARHGRWAHLTCAPKGRR